MLIADFPLAYAADPANSALKKSKVDPELEAMLAQGNLNALVPVIIFLEDQPLYTISKEVKQEYLPLLNEQKNRIKNIYKRLRDDYFDDKGYPGYVECEDPISLYNYESQMLTKTDNQTIKESLEASENLLSEMRMEILNRVVANTSRLGFVNWIRSLGGRIKSEYSLFNAISADVTLRRVIDIANHPGVAKVIKNKSYRILLDSSPGTIRATTWWDNGYTGIWDVAIVDTGVDNSHPDLIYNVFDEESFVDMNDDGIPDEDEDDYHGHGTAIAGVLASYHDTYKGVARSLNVIINAKAANASGDFDMDHIMDAVEWAISEAGNSGADVINLSGGQSTVYDDDQFARFFDAVVDCLGIPVAIAAGLDTQEVFTPGIAYNIFCVAAANDHGNVDRDDDTLWGPRTRTGTVGERRKPDITAPGEGIKTTNNDWEECGEHEFHEVPAGTSIACPHIAGACLLLMDYGIIDPMEIKALLLNTAEKRPPIVGSGGWDEGWGWGYVDLDHAYWHKDDIFTGTVDDEEGDDFKLFKGTMFPDDTVTLVWNRHVIYNGSNPPSTWYRLSDLDLELWQESTGSRIALSDSEIDNVEQVTLDAEGQEDVVVKVHVGQIFASGIDTEDFALSTEEGFVETCPSFDISYDFYNISVGIPFEVTATIWNSGIKAHDVEAILNLPPGFTLVSGSNPQNLGDISAGSAKITSWTVKAEDRGIYPLWVTVESDCYGESFTGERGSVAYINGIPDKPSKPLGPTSGVRGEAYTYITSTDDPEGNDVWYQFDWDDDSTKTVGPYSSGSDASGSHIWYSNGIYNMRTRAKDGYNVWSDWSDPFTVNITDPGGGGGGGGPGEFHVLCPRLFVWNGSDYAEEFIFDLHGDSDVTMCRTIGQLLVPEGDHYLLSLRELGETISHIDYVKLYAVDTEGVMHECHLTGAVHSELGNVKQLLLHDDDERIDLGPSQTIDFKFNMADVENIDYFIFEIQGYEPN